MRLALFTLTVGGIIAPSFFDVFKVVFHFFLNLSKPTGYTSLCYCV